MDQTQRPAVPTASPLQKAQGIRSRLFALWQDYGYLLLAAFIPAVIMYLIYAARLVHPFGDESVLVLDLTGQYVFFYEGLRDILIGEGSLLYSFSRSLGGEFMGIFDYYVASPFASILALFPRDKMLEALLTLFILKTGLCGFTMGFLLHKISVKHNKLTIITFAVMYALTSYAVVQQHNSMWIDAVLWLPILVYGIQELIKRGRFRVYVFALAIILISNFYIGYMACIFTVIYCFYYYFAHNQNNENNPTGEKNHLARSVLRVAVWSVLALGIAAFIIVTARYSLAMGKDEFSTPNWEITQKFELFEFFYKLLPGSYDTVTPRGLPFVYCGVLTLIMVPGYFLCKKFSNREKVAAALVILVFVGSMAISSLDLIWHGFQKPNWLNYRYSFMLCFFLIMLAFRAFEQVEFINRKSLLCVAAFIGLFVLIAQELSGYLFTEAIDKGDVKAVFRPYATVWLTLACLFIFTVIICLKGRVKPRFKETLSVVLLFAVCIEVFLNGLSEMNALDVDVTYSGYSKYNNFLYTYRPVVDKIEEYDDGFYRMEKTYHQKTNDNFALRIKGFSNSTSTLDRSALDFLQSMGYYSQSHKSQYYGGTIVSDSLLGMKYLIYTNEVDKRNDADYYVPDPEQYYGKPIFTPEDYEYDEDFEPIRQPYVYRNPYAMSLVYAVNDAWLNFDISQYHSPFHQMNAMITAMLGEDELVEVFKPAVQNGEPTLNHLTWDKNKVQYFDMSKYPPDGLPYYKYTQAKGETGSLTYSYTVPTNTELFFFYPSDYRRQVKLQVNSNRQLDYGSNESNRIIALGQVSDPDIKLKVTLNNSSNNLYVMEDSAYVFYIDMAVFEDVMSRLQAMPQMQIDSSSTDQNITGTMSTTADRQLVFTSIPYDAGWNIKVDGKAVETLKTADSLVSFYVEGSGDHTIQLSYMPASVLAALICSIICALIFLVLLFGYRFFVKVPVMKNLMGIQRPDLPAVESPEAKRAPANGDIGAEPVIQRIASPTSKDTRGAKGHKTTNQTKGNPQRKK